MVVKDVLPSIQIPFGPPVLFAIISGLFGLLLWQLWNEPRNDWAKLPGPKAYPLLGNWEVFAYAKKRQMHAFFADMVEAYGTTIRVSIGTRCSLQSLILHD
jgi:hypothetical protein